MADLQRLADHPDADLVASVRATLLDTVRSVLQGANRVALIDFPYHRNAGDAAIWAGERAVLNALGVEVAYVADAGRYHASRLREALPEGPVLLSGGGNVGDLWQWSQALRERALRDLPDRRVIQLPQSIHFRDPARAAAFAAVVRGHGDYTFMARDAASAGAAGDLAPVDVILAPDMAFGMGALPRASPPATRVLALARDDVEGVSGLRSAACGRATVVDWSLNPVDTLRWQALRSVPRASRLAALSAVASRLTRPVNDAAMEAMCRLVLLRGVQLLSSADVVVTDRLHAHVLCVLLGIPHVVLDNSYGKISSLHEQWTSTSRTTVWATDAVSALEMGHAMAPTR